MYDDVVEGILRDILDAIPDGVYVTDADREIIFWNDAAARITGYTAEDVLGSRCCDVLADRDAGGVSLCEASCFLSRSIETGEPQDAPEVYLRRDDGERLGVAVNTRRLSVGGEVFGVKVFRELTAVGGRDVAFAIQQTSDTSVTDPLSGLLNRNYVDALLEQQFHLFRRVGLHFAVTLVDVDGMTKINDEYGRETGDEALRFVASILANNTRKMDTLARQGADEFVIVSPIRTAAGAEEIGKRTLALIRGSELTTATEEVLPLRVSVGGAVVRVDDRDQGQILARAEQVLDEIRRAGGDGFRFSY